MTLYITAQELQFSTGVVVQYSLYSTTVGELCVDQLAAFVCVLEANNVQGLVMYECKEGKRVCQFLCVCALFGLDYWGTPLLLLYRCMWEACMDTATLHQPIRMC